MNAVTSFNYDPRWLDDDDAFPVDNPPADGEELEFRVVYGNYILARLNTKDDAKRFRNRRGHGRIIAVPLGQKWVNPTPDQIAAECEAITSGWSVEEYRQRMLQRTVDTSALRKRMGSSLTSAALGRNGGRR